MDGRDESDDIGSSHRSGEPAAVKASPAVVGTSGGRLEGCDALAKAISSTLGSVMKEFDSRAEGAIESQDELTRSIDRLTGGYFVSLIIFLPKLESKFVLLM